MVVTEEFCLPDYGGGSLVNLMASVREALGGGAGGIPLALLPPQDLPATHHVVLLVVDGLGHDFLLAHPGRLSAHLRGALTSVFPSTTAAAIPTFLTGLAPQRHGLTGWHMYFPELGAVIAPLPFRTRVGKQPLTQAGVTVEGLFGLTPLANHLPLPCHVVSPRHIVDSEFNRALSGRATRHGYGSVEEMFATLARILESADSRCYVHAYWPELDTLAHLHGVTSPQVSAAFAALDTAFGNFLDRLPGVPVQVIVTADHGFMDVTHTIDLGDHPALRDCLRLPLCGEPRAAFAYVRAGRERAFEEHVRTALADRVDLIASREALAAGWFGRGTPHPALEDRIGDYLLLPRAGVIIRDWVMGEERYVHLGVHGGLSAREMRVPLVLAATG